MVNKWHIDNYVLSLRYMHTCTCILKHEDPRPSPPAAGDKADSPLCQLQHSRSDPVDWGLVSLIENMSVGDKVLPLIC